MKKFLYAALAASLVLPGAAYAKQADNRQETHQTTTPGKSDPKQQKGTTQQGKQQQTTSRAAPQASATGKQASSSKHPFAKGKRFSRSQAPNYRRVSYCENSRLSAPPSGYVWVRAGDDALLGVIDDVAASSSRRMCIYARNGVCF